MKSLSQKNRLIISLVALIVTFVLLFTVVFAWFTIVASTGSVSFIVARINSQITLFKALDNNYDGIPNFGLDASDPAGTDEHFLYTNLGSSQAIAESAANIELLMQMDDLMPSQIHTYKIFIVNNSEASNLVRLVFSGYDTANYPNDSTTNTYTATDFDNFIRCLSLMSVSIGQEVDNEVVYGDKVYFGNTAFVEDGDNRVCNLSIISALNIASILQPNQNKMNLYLQFEVETLATLTASVEDGGAGLTITNQEYQALQGNSFALPLLMVYLEID